MSTDYEIRCTCGTPPGFYEHRYTRDNWRSPEEVNVLLSMRTELAAVARAVVLYAPRPNGFSPDGWNGSDSMFPRICEFFAQHEGHEMHIFNEYGDRWPNCQDGKHDMERKWRDYAKCRVCEYSEHTPVKP